MRWLDNDWLWYGVIVLWLLSLLLMPAAPFELDHCCRWVVR